ncbi:hypothetical protein A500_10994 [Clostridium sartagoforme AAU1]|uniref:Uncharacterized protein n=1 Tax=Clostridium sartagoforme AAU1 TaxID=1202534 RepID=R9C6W3_9CLOT|nr:hypothetical protein A500_10994 [Clostridium sartagoforme AAU1]
MTTALENNENIEIKFDISKYYLKEDREEILREVRSKDYRKIGEIKKTLRSDIKYEAIRAVIIEEIFLKNKKLINDN